MKKQQVWLVTGSSKGLGLALSKKLLAEGHKVAATSRKMNDLIQAIGKKSDNFLPLEVDLPNGNSVQKAVEETIKTFGNIDVVVNNAGYGQNGVFEELNEKEIQQNFDVNVFGITNMLRAVLPFMRNQKAGHIINISSIIGYKGTYPGWGCYVATKFAVSGLTEALAAEVKSLGIKVTVVYPGAFRTSFLTKESLVVTNNELLAAYPEAKTSLDLHLNEFAGNQEGDPEKAATALIEIAETENPPLHLFLGKDSFNFAEQQIENVKSDLETWKDLSLSTGY